MRKRKRVAIPVLVLGGLLVLFVALRKSEKTGPAVPGQDTPAQIMDPADPEKGAPAQQGAGQERAFPEVPCNLSVSPEDADIASCEGGSVADILASLGKTWGAVAESKGTSVVKGPDAEKMTAALEEYAVCRAFGSKDVSMCRLESKSAVDSSFFDSHARDGANCINTLHDFFAKEYLAGKRHETSVCEYLMADILHDHPRSGIKGMSSAEFCRVAATGMENVCAGLPALDRKSCPKIFPARGSDCGGNDDCLEDFGLYRAVKTDDPAKCTAGMRPYCRMFLSKGKVSCSDLAARVSKVYCSALAKAGKSSPKGMKK